MTQNHCHQELDTIILTHDIPEQELKQGDVGAIVHCYSDNAACEVEFVNSDGKTIALLTLTHNDMTQEREKYRWGLGGHSILHA